MEALADRYLATVQHQAPATVRKKKDIAQRIKDKWGVLQAKDLKKSQVMAWSASFKFGSGSRDKHLRVVRAMFRLAVDDRIFALSPVDGVCEEKTEKPIRHTPSLAEFQAIVDSIRSRPFADTRKESADFVEFLGLAGLGLTCPGRGRVTLLLIGGNLGARLHIFLQKTAYRTRIGSRSHRQTQPSGFFHVAAMLVGMGDTPYSCVQPPI